MKNLKNIILLFILIAFTCSINVFADNMKITTTLSLLLDKEVASTISTNTSTSAWHALSMQAAHQFYVVDNNGYRTNYMNARINTTACVSGLTPGIWTLHMKNKNFTVLNSVTGHWLY